MKNCLVAQSGGPTAAINASLAGVIHAALKSKDIQTVYGAVHGILGVQEENFLNLTELFEENTGALELLMATPSMYLGSCRHRLSDDSNKMEQLFSIFEKHDIGYFFYIGGNDSMDTVQKLSAYAKQIQSSVRIMGVPKTIDNDLRETDHTPGFGSAAKYIATSMREIAFDTIIYPVKNVNIVEIMGRDAGWLTMSSALARTAELPAPHLIYLPEVAFSEQKFIEDVKKKLEEHKNIVVAVSEGIKDETGAYVSAKTDKKDVFGHAELNGAASYLAALVTQHIGCKVRSIELNILQRCASHLASKTDLDESFLLGEMAVRAALLGRSGEMSVIRRTSDTPYEVVYETTPIELVANLERCVPRDYINEEGNDVTEAAITYLRPLILGEVQPKYVNGVPIGLVR